MVGVVGGSGFYSLLDDAEEHDLDTPYGRPSGPVTTGVLAGRDVAFVPRHGPEHRYAPHVVPYRANLWALRSLGVRQVLSLSAVGSLTTGLPTGALVVPDQLVDRTTGRMQSYVERGALHVPFADPYCARLRDTLGRQPGVRSGGTMVVVEGPLVPVLGRAAPGGIQNYLTARPRA